MFFDSKEYPDVIFGHYCIITSALTQSTIEINLADNSVCASLAYAQQYSECAIFLMIFSARSSKLVAIDILNKKRATRINL